MLHLREEQPYQMRVDTEKCRGDSCGCARLCNRIFQCPGLIWDSETETAQIDEKKNRKETVPD